MKKGFWDKFDDLMESLPNHINNEITTVGSMNKISTSGSSIVQSGDKTQITQNGDKIVITSKRGKLKITVNGKEYVEKA